MSVEHHQKRLCIRFFGRFDGLFQDLERGRRYGARNLDPVDSGASFRRRVFSEHRGATKQKACPPEAQESQKPCQIAGALCSSQHRESTCALLECSGNADPANVFRALMGFLTGTTFGDCQRVQSH